MFVYSRGITPKSRGNVKTMRLIYYCIVVTMFKFRKQFIRDKIYYFAIFATDFKA